MTRDRLITYTTTAMSEAEAEGNDPVREQCRGFLRGLGAADFEPPRVSARRSYVLRAFHDGRDEGERLARLFAEANGGPIDDDDALRAIGSI